MGEIKKPNCETCPYYEQRSMMCIKEPETVSKISKALCSHHPDFEIWKAHQPSTYKCKTCGEDQKNYFHKCVNGEICCDSCWWYFIEKEAKRMGYI